MVSQDSSIFQNNIQNLNQNYGCSYEEISKLLVGYPLIFTNLSEKLKEKQNLLVKYLGFDDQQFFNFLKKNPFILEIDGEKLYWTIIFLRNKQFSIKELNQLIDQNPDILTIQQKTLEQNFQFFFRLNLKGKTVNNIMLKYPQFLTFAPELMLHPKINLLTSYNVSIEVQKEILLNNPEIFLKSLGSMELKMKYLERRWKMKFNEDYDFPAILAFNYNETIRPRGEFMMKYGKQPWADFIYLSDQKFCETYQFDFEQFQKLKNDRILNQEEDLKKRFYHSFFNYDIYQK